MYIAGIWSLAGVLIITLMIPHLILWVKGVVSARVFAGVAVAVVAAVHIYFGLLESTQWNHSTGLQIHGLSQDVADQTRRVGQNMGLYNIILALVLVGTFFLGRLDAFRAQSVLLALIIAAGIIGTLTIGSPKIVIVQSLPAMLALVAVVAGRPGSIGEEQVIEKIIDIEKGLLDRKTNGRRKETNTVLRGQHPKSVGFVVADFVVSDSLPDSLKSGVFAKPGRTYGAVARFSNARNMGDTEPGGHGMAIKLFGVEGPKLMPDASETRTQDFVLLDNPVFFVRDAFDYLDFERAQLWATDKDGNTSKGLLALAYPRPSNLWTLTRKVQTKPAINPLGATYWSVLPFRLGSRVAKFRVTPATPATAIPVPAENSINKDLVAKLSGPPPAGGWTFAFEAQLQTDADLMPLEDATADWGTDPSQFVRLATITIRPRESLKRFGEHLALNWPASPETGEDADKIRTGSEDLSFSPWHGLVEHEPLGGINRVRRRVYEEISQKRHESNRRGQRSEPVEVAPSTK